MEAWIERDRGIAPGGARRAGPTLPGLVLATALALGAAPLAAQGIAPGGAPSSFSELSDRLSPAVVNITTTTTVADVAQGLRPIIPEGSPFEEFFAFLRSMEAYKSALNDQNTTLMVEPNSAFFDYLHSPAARSDDEAAPGAAERPAQGTRAGLD